MKIVELGRSEGRSKRTCVRGRGQRKERRGRGE